jgi:dTDP-4-dehydrorhamnose reductase
MCYRVNVLGTRNVARACAQRGLHLITVSTDYVFRGDSDEPYRETDEADPIDWYGETKCLAEAETREVPSWTIVRLAFPYGPAPGNGGLLGKMLRVYDEGGTLNLFRDQFITPSYLRDIAQGLCLICAKPPKGEVFHLAGSTWTTPYDFGRTLADIFGLDTGRFVATSLNDFAGSDHRPRHRSLRLDTTKWIEFALRSGVPAPLGITEGLRRSKEAMGDERYARALR